jgi:hypothetical protein
MFSQPQAIVADAWKSTASLLQSGAIKPIVAKTFPLVEAADALRYLVEGPLREGSSHNLTAMGGENITGIPQLAKGSHYAQA